MNVVNSLLHISGLKLHGSVKLNICSYHHILFPVITLHSLYLVLLNCKSWMMLYHNYTTCYKCQDKSMTFHYTKQKLIICSSSFSFQTRCYQPHVSHVSPPPPHTHIVIPKHFTVCFFWPEDTLSNLLLVIICARSWKLPALSPAFNVDLFSWTLF